MTSFFSLSRSLTARWHPLLGSFLIIGFVVALAAFAAYQSRLHHERQARISATNLSQVLGNHVTSVIEKIDLSLSTIALAALQHRNEKGEIDSGQLNRLLAQQQPLLPCATIMLASDSAGVYKFGPTEITSRNIDVSDREYFQQLRDNSQSSLAMGGPYRNRINNELGVIFARRLSYPDGTFAGVVAAFVDRPRLEEMLSSLDLGIDGVASLRTANLTLMARNPKLESLGDFSNKSASAEFFESVKAEPGEGTFYDTNPADGIHRRLAYRKLDDFPLYVAVGLSTQDYLAPWRDEVIQLAGIVAIASLVILWLCRNAARATNNEQAANRLLQEALEQTAVGLSIFDSQQRLVLCNGTVRGFFPELQDILKPGVKADYVLRTGVLRGAHPEAQGDPERWASERLKLHQTATGQPFEQQLRDGRQLLVMENRTPSGYVITSRIDITELNQYRQRLEQLVEIRTIELQSALDQFRILVELSPTALAMFDRDLRYLATSRRWQGLYGQGSSLVGKHMYDVAPDVPEGWKAANRAALAGVAESREEDLWVRADGSEQWVRWSVFPWAGGAKDNGGIIISVEDITDRKQAEQQLQEREAHFRATFEQAGVGVCHSAIDGRFLRVNDKYCSILGYEREELLCLSYRDVSYPEDIDKSRDARDLLLAGAHGSHGMEKRYVRKDGSVIWANVALALVRKPCGEPDYILAVIEDIQQRKAAELALAAERETRQALLEQEVAKRTAELQAANQQLEGFVYASSHDLRAPLARISNFSTLLEQNYRDRLEGDGLLFLDFIRSNALRLTNLIDDLLAHALVDRQVTSLQSIDVRHAVRAALESKAEEVQKNGVFVRLTLPAVEVLADPYGLSQVLHNLLENALKYSAEVAEPVIEIGGEETEGQFHLWVRDNGIGFDMEYQDKIFEIFRRLHTYTEYEGSGVGLALVKRAMDRMGGKVWAESEPGEGATFSLAFKIAPEFVEV